jgi:superfamily II DNA/RNA helicase
MHEYGVPESDFIRIPRSPALLFSLTVGMLGDVAVSVITGQASAEGISETSSHLMFCARFFDSYFESRLDEERDPHMLLLASATYYLADFPGSASVIASRIPVPCPDLDAGGLEEILSWLVKRDFGRELNLPTDIYPGVSGLLEACVTFADSGDSADDVRSAVNELRRVVYRDGTARELLIVDLIGAVALVRLRNSTWSTLPRFSELDSAVWSPILKKESFIRELWPAQHLLGERGLYRGISAVVQMPTSAGKTRALDLIIRGAFYSSRTSLAIVVAPFRALCEEIRQSSSRAFSGESINVDELSDVQQADFDLDIFLSRQQVLVMTPEKCLYLLRHNPEMADSLGLLIYDEGHQFDSGRRGVTYELLLTSLKQAVPETTQTVLISAVLNNAQVIGDWLLGAPATVVSGATLLPMTRALAFVSWLDTRGRLEFTDPSDPDIGEFFVPRIIEQQTLNRFPRERTNRVFPEHQSTSIGLFLALKVAESGGVALFAGTKPTASAMVKKAVEVYQRGFDVPSPANFSDADEIARLVRQNEANLGEVAASSQAAQLGVFSHHGNTPHGIRLAVEYAMKEGLARVVVCTSTLAQGVNLPIRYLIVTSAMQGSERIKTRDFHNLLGRAGRAGMHTEGTVIFSDPNIFDLRNSRNEGWRWPITKALLDPSKSEECRSSLLSVLDPILSADGELSFRLKVSALVSTYIAGASGLHRLAKRLAEKYQVQNRTFTETEILQQLLVKSEYLSAIESFLMAHWNEEVDGTKMTAASLAETTFAFHLASAAQRERLIELFELLATNIEGRVTDPSIRKVFSRSLFGLTDNVEIQEWVGKNADSLSSRTDVIELLRDIWPLFQRFVRNKMYVRCNPAEPLLPFAERWIGGVPFSDLLDDLNTANCRFGDKRPLKPTIENVVDICESGLGFDGMLVVGAVAEMFALLLPDETQVTELLKQLQKQVKYGVPTDLAITLYELGFADRVIAQESATLIGGASSRKRVIRRLKSREDAVRELLSQYPSYFTHVLDNLLL